MTEPMNPIETAARSDASAAGSGRPAPGHADTPTRVLPSDREASEQAGGSVTIDTEIAASSGDKAAPGGTVLPDPHAPGSSQVTATAIVNTHRMREERRIDSVALAFIAAESAGFASIDTIRERYGKREADMLMERARQKAREFLAMVDAAVKFDRDEANRETEQRLLLELHRNIANASGPHYVGGRI